MNRLKRIPLSNQDIYSRLNGRTNVIMYNQLNQVNDIDDVMKNDSVVILFEKQPKNGHWVALIKNYNRTRNRPTIEFFDSYGMFPDEEKKYIDDGFLFQSNQKYNKLSELLTRASEKYDIEYNNYKLQRKTKDISTCGRHVISRILLKDLDIDEYNKLMRSFKGYSPDDIATIISELNI